MDPKNSRGTGLIPILLPQNVHDMGFFEIFEPGGHRNGGRQGRGLAGKHTCRTRCGGWSAEPGCRRAGGRLNRGGMRQQRFGVVGNFRWQIVDGDEIIVRQNLGSIHGILQLTHIPGPVIGFDRAQRILADGPVPTKKHTCQQDDIPVSLAQRGQFQ